MSQSTYNINQSEYPEFSSTEYPPLKYKQIAFDLDGTIFEEVTDVEKTWKENVDLIPMPRASAVFKKLKIYGIEILIHTCRPHYHYKYLVEQFGKNAIPFDLILFYTKPRADLYVDNKALRYTSMDQLLNDIEKMLP